MSITICIPKELTKEFLGTLVLDVLHDSKGRGVLQGQKLSQLTDLIAHSFRDGCRRSPNINENQTNTQNDRDFAVLKNWVFGNVFEFLWDFWDGNKKAFGDFTHPPDFTNLHFTYFRRETLLPIRSVGDKPDDDTFISLGSNRKGIEVENYMRQKNLMKSPLKTVTFTSPKNQNFYEASKGFVDGIRLVTNKDALVCLDMKSAAGLLRSITDQIGYVSGLPVYADPGYNMAGMSAIRNNSLISFESKNATFTYRINVETPFGILEFFEVEYSWGNPTEFDRDYLTVRVNDTFFHKGLPRSGYMAEALGNYFSSKFVDTQISPQETLAEKRKELLWHLNETVQIKEFSEVYRKLRCKESIINDFIELIDSIGVCEDAVLLLSWADSDGVKIAYLLSTLQNLHFFGLKPNSSIVSPEEMILYLSELLANNKSIKTVAFCFHQINLLVGLQDQRIVGMLNEQWLENGVNKGKLMNQVDKLVKEYYSSTLEKLTKAKVQQYLNKYCSNSNLSPVKMRKEVVKMVSDHIAFAAPQFLGVSSNNSIILFSLLDLCERVGIYPDTGYSLREETLHDALKMVLGKFSGDFGQIVWCMATGNIFASEDNNTSAMACLLHRVPVDYIMCNNWDVLSNRWVSIHGLGDGGSVDASF